MANNSYQTPTKEKSKPANTVDSGKRKAPLIKTAVGRLNFVYLAKPDSGREYSNDKYKVDLLFSKEKWQDDDCKQMRVAAIMEARHFFKNDKIKSISEFKSPFKDGDEKDMDKESSKPYKGHWYITINSNFKPKVLGPDKQPMSDTEVEAIKSGDYARAVCAVVGFKQKGGGITFAMNVLQFARVGEAIGGGASAASMELLDELEIDLEDVDLESSSDDAEDALDAEDADV